ncbi:MAG: mannose-1-phosphate guanylyltransferase [Candidatus Promineifilaceae bacterium]
MGQQDAGDPLLKENSMYYPLIMAGGTGTRLWPLSRRKYPKQALKLVGERTLMQHAVDRLIPQVPAGQIIVITRQEHVQPLSEQVPELPQDNFIVEPEGRGTAPAIGLAAIHLQQRDPEAVMAVLTADHFISDISGFRRALAAAEEVARDGYLVTLGIKPTFPSTGYGYVHQGQHIKQVDGLDVYQADRFTEKPDAEEAQQLVESGVYSWNSGMFVWRVDRILEEFQRQMPDFYDQLQEVDAVLEQPGYAETLDRVWPAVEKETIDYGVMEGADRVAVIPVDIGWHDVGSWASLLEVLPADEEGNTVVGNHVGIDSSDLLVVGGDRLIATIGVEGLVIVDTEDALLICTKEREQDVKAMVELLEANGRDNLL